MAKITWVGQAYFRISVSNSKDQQTNIVIDPFGDIGLKMPSFEADIAMITHQHADHNNIKSIKGKYFLIQDPGEYEIKGLFIQGIPSFHDDKNGKERGNNIIYTIEAEELRFCHLGDLGQKELTEEQLENIGRVDILMIPVGGVYTISYAEALKIISQIEPKIVIPMHYALPGLKFQLDEVGKFLKAMGNNSIEPQDKLNVKSSSLPKDGAMEIAVLKP